MPPRDRLIRLHIQNDPLSPNDAVTPPRFAKGASGSRDLRRRLRVTFGVDPPALEEGLREAEILVVAHVDGRDLRGARAAPEVDPVDQRRRREAACRSCRRTSC